MIQTAPTSTQLLAGQRDLDPFRSRDEQSAFQFVCFPCLSLTPSLSLSLSLSVGSHCLRQTNLAEHGWLRASALGFLQTRTQTRGAKCAASGGLRASVVSVARSATRGWPPSKVRGTFQLLQMPPCGLLASLDKARECCCCSLSSSGFAMARWADRLVEQEDEGAWMRQRAASKGRGKEVALLHLW